MNVKTCLSALALGAASLGASLSSQAETVDISISNLTQGIYFTPILVSAHPEGMHLFEVGTDASMALQAMAEGGSIDALAMAMTAGGALNSENPAAGLLAPAATVTITDWDTEAYNQLSIVAMMLPTNDGFVGLDDWSIPSTPGTYTFNLNAYDAGTEINDELINTETGGMPGTAGFPANPGANGGTGGSGVAATEENGSVHIHRGNLGDTDSAGGSSDVDSRIHRWLNPVAKVVVTVK